MAAGKTVAIAAPRGPTADGIGRMLAEAGYRVVNHATTVAELFRAVSARCPDVTLVHHSLLGERLTTVRRLSDRSCRVVVLADPEWDGSTAHGAMKAGATGYLSVHEPAERFLHSLELVLQGAIVVSPSLGHLMWKEPEISQRGPHAELSERERQVALLVSQGRSNREIAAVIGVSVHTVKGHVSHILVKLDLRNRQQIAAYFARNGMLHLGPDEADRES